MSRVPQNFCSVIVWNNCALDGLDLSRHFFRFFGSSVIGFNISRGWIGRNLGLRLNPGVQDMQPLTLLARLTFPWERDAIDNLIRDSNGLHLTAAAALLLITVFRFFIQMTGAVFLRRRGPRASGRF